MNNNNNINDKNINEDDKKGGSYDMNIASNVYPQNMQMMNPSMMNPATGDIGGDMYNQMSIQNSNLLNYMEPSKTTLYIIPAGTILYHGSLNKESFNPYDIRLGDDKLVSYFTSNKALAADYIVGCALYPTKTGYIHKFRVKKNINRVLIVSSFEKQPHWTLSFIEDSFCSRKFRIQLDGIGFFFPKMDKNDPGSIGPGMGYSNQYAMTDPSMSGQMYGGSMGMNVNTGMGFDAEFAICDPNEYLEYISTQRCTSMRKLNAEYHFSR